VNPDGERRGISMSATTVGVYDATVSEVDREEERFRRGRHRMHVESVAPRGTLSTLGAPSPGSPPG